MKFKQNIVELKDLIKKKAGSIFNGVKSKGRKALVRISEFCKRRPFVVCLANRMLIIAKCRRKNQNRKQPCRCTKGMRML